MIDTDLKNRVVLITGTNSPLGIGAGSVRVFACEGTRSSKSFFRENGGTP